MLNILAFISLAGLVYCVIVIPNYNIDVSYYKETKSKKVKDRILKKAKCKNFQQLKDKQLGGYILFVLCLIVLIGTQIIKGNSSYKPYMCNFKETDNCPDKGESLFKIYFDTKYSNHDECFQEMKRFSMSQEMLRKYPSDKWAFGCDKKWK